MKLTKEHIGKKVRMSHWDEGIASEVISVHNNEVWIQLSSGEHTTEQTNDNWIIVEPAKKPSERIAEIIGHTSSYPEWNQKAIEAIITFLDEQAELKK